MRQAAALGAMLLAFSSAALADAPVKTLEIHAQLISRFEIGSDRAQFGPLEFVGGLALSSSDADLGALSAIRFLQPGTDFIGVADTGFWFFGRLEHDAEGRPSGMSRFTMQEMVGKDGRILGEKWLTDAEGLGLKDGKVTASFERVHRVSEYALDPADMKGPLRDLDFLVPARELRSNRGFETIAVAPVDGPFQGARVLVSEKSLDKNGDIFGAVIEGPLKGVFTVARSGEFDITDGAFLPNGDLLLLERSFAMSEGVKMRLRRIAGDSIRKGARVDGEVLLVADMGYQIDNMEGMDVWKRADGATMVSIISDDNHSILQRNLYLEFRLAD